LSSVNLNRRRRIKSNNSNAAFANPTHFPKVFNYYLIAAGAAAILGGNLMTVTDGFKLIIGIALGLVFLILASFIGCGLLAGLMGP